MELCGVAGGLRQSEGVDFDGRDGRWGELTG